MNFVEDALNQLKNERPVFHSEDDLKLSFAFIIQQRNPTWKVRLEKPIPMKMTLRDQSEVIVRSAIDIVVNDDKGNVIPIELKYKTKKCNVQFENEDYILSDHGAADIGRYSFRKDIHRIEQYKSDHSNCTFGYVLIITNDRTYFQNNVFAKNSLDKHFSFHHGWKLPRQDNSWNYEKVDENKYRFDQINNCWVSLKSKKHWTYGKGLFFKLDLKNEYDIEWKDYSLLGKTKFKYLSLKV